MIKKTILILLLAFSMFECATFAYSENFDFMLNVMGVSKTNIHGKELNEEIYDCYSLFVYGSPLDGYDGQRFKEVEDGRWQKGKKSFQGEGIRGEYWILRRK